MQEPDLSPSSGFPDTPGSCPIKECIQMALFFVLWLGFEYARPGVTRLTTATATLDSARAST